MSRADRREDVMGKVAVGAQVAFAVAAAAVIAWVAFVVVVPRPGRWAVWALPAVIAVAGTLALVWVWPAGDRSRREAGVALALGAASLALGFGAMILVGMGISLVFGDESRRSTRAIYEL